MSKPLTKAGRYQLVSELGRGAMGIVYEGYDPVIGRSVAIKTMLTEGLSGNEYETYRARFQREAQSAGMLAHPNIVTIYDFGEDEGFLYLAMELLRGKSLEKLLQEQSVLPIETIIPIYLQVCSALDYAHDHKIVHRDIKPANIMILENGAVKVADFGIAKMMTTGMTRAGQILGTPNYMSPEQVKGRGVDGRSDIFALGVILYELVTGEKPFSGQNVTTVIYKIMHENPIPPRELEPTISPGLSLVISKALAKGMDDRYQTCNELAEDLKNYRSLGVPGITSATAVIQSPMIALAPNETAAIDLPHLLDAARMHAATPAPAPPTVKAPAAKPQAGGPALEAAAPSVPVRVSAPQAAPPPPVPPAPSASPAAMSSVRPAPRAAPPVIPPPAPVQIKTYAELPAPLDAVELEPSPAARPAEAPPAPAPAAGHRIPRVVWIAAAALLIVAALGGYFLPHRGQPTAPAQGAVSAPAISPSAGQRSNPDQAAAPEANGNALPSGANPANQASEANRSNRANQAIAANQGSRPIRAAGGQVEAGAKVTPTPPVTRSAHQPQEPKTEESRPARPSAAPAVRGGAGQLSISSNVDGARISIDGKGEQDWVAPHTFNLPAGIHQVAVLKDGYVTWGHSVTIEAGASQSVAAELAPPTGEVDIDTVPTGLEVFIDGKSVGVTPVRTSVSVGEHKYRINPPTGQAPFESTVTAKETSIARKSISFR